MAFKSKLLTTAAIPLIALTWMGPVSAAPMMRTGTTVEAQSLVVQVQSNDDELLKQKQQERREQRQKERQEQRQKKQEQGADKEQQRRKKQAQDEQQQMRKSNDAEQTAPRRKKDAEQKQPVQKVQPSDEAPVKPRKKQAQEEQQKQQPRKVDGSDESKPRSKSNAGAQQDQQNKGSIEEIQTKPNNKQKNADAKKQADRPQRDKRKEAIANDPSKTTDTIELPVKNGAAVLDSDKDADRSAASRERRKAAREEAKPRPVPKSDRDAQAGFRGDKDKVRIQPVMRDKGERITGFKGYDYGNGRRVGRDKDDVRVIVNIGGRTVVRDDDRFRMGRNGQTRYERLDSGRIREVVIRPNGDRIVTVRNRYGEIIRRSRIDARDREIVIFYSPLLDQGRDRLYLVDAGAALPPMRLQVPLDDYIVDVSGEPDRDFVEFLEEPPVEPVERVYSVDEVKYSARLRDKVRRIDLDTITFDTGSADIDMGQAGSLKRVGAAIKEILDRDPGETFLIEGHTDAVGSDESNLVLSDERAESVANVLSDVYDIPPENLVTQGYGERFLKVETDGAERMNRRVTIRRITPLVRPVAANEE